MDCVKFRDPSAEKDNTGRVHAILRRRPDSLIFPRISVRSFRPMDPGVFC